MHRFCTLHGCDVEGTMGQPDPPAFPDRVKPLNNKSVFCRALQAPSPLYGPFLVISLSSADLLSPSIYGLLLVASWMIDFF